MIQTPTVLVLGAGASIPYGFPSGHDLKIQVQGIGCLGPGHSDKLRIDKEESEAFCRALRFSGQPSVDAFLEHRPEFVELGKLYIAYSLIAYERPALLFPKDTHWYEFLWQQMGTSFEEFQENKLSVITFNYDRSLEQFLLTALMNSYGKSMEEAAAKLESIPIIHVYGKLGALCEEGTATRDARPYNKEPTPRDVAIGARGIQILSEDRQESSAFDEAHELLISAMKVYFVGFGYNETNMKRLNLPVKGTEHYTHERRLVGSCYSLTEAEKGVIEMKYHGLELRSPLHDAYEFLRNEESFLRR